MAYKVRASDYLARAKELLSLEAHPSFFYAAFELRCGIETRLKEYFDAQAETTLKKRNGWQIDKLAKQVEAVFEIGSNKGYRMSVFDAKTNLTISVLMYTSVTKQLQKFGERLGDYLHSQASIKVDDADFWPKFRCLLHLTLEELTFACSGKLMAPPLIHPKNPGERFFCIDGDQREIFSSGREIGWRYEIYEVVPLDESSFDGANCQ